jgi:hypothetical protein
VILDDGLSQAGTLLGVRVRNINREIDHLFIRNIIGFVIWSKIVTTTSKRRFMTLWKRNTYRDNQQKL